MLLVVDVGNTQTHFGTFRDGELREHWRFATVRQSTSDQLGAALRNLLELRTSRWSRSRPRSSLPPCPCSAPNGRDGRALPRPRDARRRTRASRPACRSATTILARSAPIASSTPSPRTTASAAPASSSTSAPPSPTTWSPPRASTSAGSSRPGFEISLEALTERAAALPQVDVAAPRALIGKTTIDAIRSGIVYGFAGQVDGIVSACAPSSARRPRRSPPAAWPPDRAPSRVRSKRSTTC